MRKKIVRRKQDIPLTTKNLVGILISSGIGMLTIIILTLMVSLILTKSSVISDSVGAYFIGCIVFGSLVNGFIASKQCSFKGLVSGIISSIPLAFFITIFMLIFSHGQLSSKTLILYSGIVVCSALGGIFSANTKRRK